MSTAKTYAEREDARRASVRRRERHDMGDKKPIDLSVLPPELQEAARRLQAATAREKQIDKDLEQLDAKKTQLGKQLEQHKQNIHERGIKILGLREKMSEEFDKQMTESEKRWGKAHQVRESSPPRGGHGR